MVSSHLYVSPPPKPSQAPAIHKFAKIRCEKNELKKKFLQSVKLNTCSKEDLIIMVKAFYDLFKQHNKLTQEGIYQKNQMKEAKYTIKQ